MLSSALVLLQLLVLAPPPPEYAEMKRRAEEHYARGELAPARALYESIATLELPADEKRFVALRRADTQWRLATTAPGGGTSAIYEAAKASLLTLVGDAAHPAPRDDTWAEAHASLADLSWYLSRGNDWSAAEPHFTQALAFYESGRTEATRARYVAIALAASFPSWADDSFYRCYQVRLGRAVVERLGALPLTGQARAQAGFMLAMLLRDEGSAESERAEKAFKTALTGSPKALWYDEALFFYGDTLERCGNRSSRSSGACAPDYHRALELYGRVVSDYEESNSLQVGPARSRIEWITRVELEVAVSYTFLPGSEVPLSLSWRNLTTIDVAIYSVDLVHDLPAGFSGGRWDAAIPLEGKTRVAAWQEAGDRLCDHLPGQREVRVRAKLAPGAYIVVASGPSRQATQPLLVTDLSLLMRSDRQRVSAFLCNALDGAPVAGAAIVAVRDSGTAHTGTTDADGLARFDFGKEAIGGGLFVAAMAGGRPALATGGFASRASPTWRMQAFADRPAYRPGDTAHFKAVVRELRDGGLVNVAGAAVSWELRNPYGSRVEGGSTKLSAFGAFTGDVALTDKMVLGEYQLYVYDRHSRYVSTPIFRLEEYKLPELLVTVRAPQENQRPRLFRPGDTVEVEILVEHYFGGGVPNAEVQATVQALPFSPTWHKPREQPWLYPAEGGPGGGAYGWFISSQSLRTDARGKARLRLDVPKETRGNLEYAVTAAVTDASRRQVTGSGSVRVTAEPYFVWAEPVRKLWLPGEIATVDFVTFDGNEIPLAAQGNVTVQRLWAAPKESTFRRDVVVTSDVRTDAAGKATFSFTPPREGYYQVLWKRDGKPRASVLLFVSPDKNADLGYRASGLEIIPDRDTYRPGETALVLVHAPYVPRPVWFAVEGEALFHDELLRLDSFASVVRVPVTAAHATRVFFTGQTVAALAAEYAQASAVVRPPDDSLAVTVAFDKSEYRPRDKGKAEITVTDAQGKPVAAEVALTIFDEAVLAIQPEYAGDPRPVFLAKSQTDVVSSTSSFAWRSYVRLRAGISGALTQESVPRPTAAIYALPAWVDEVSPDPHQAFGQRQPLLLRACRLHEPRGAGGRSRLRALRRTRLRAAAARPPGEPEREPAWRRRAGASRRR